MYIHGVSYEYHFIYYLGSRLEYGVVTCFYYHTILDYYPINNISCVLPVIVGAMCGWRGRFQCAPDTRTCATEEREEDWNSEDAHAIAPRQNMGKLCLIFHSDR